MGLANLRAITPDEDETADRGQRTDKLIKAALSLSQAMEALGSLNILGELQVPDVKNGIDFYDEVRRFETALILEALRLTRGRQKRASELLGLNPTTLNCMIKRLGIDVGTMAETNAGQGQSVGAEASRSNVQSIRQEPTRD
ncbi:MAG: helix-turn-helix domain-containing protein [Pyrinomonadaceae bacterium]